jgi:predicted metalloenzyme YecM
MPLRKKKKKNSQIILSSKTKKLMDKKQFLKEFKDFITTIDSRIDEIGLSLDTYPIDHAAYRITNSEEFKEVTDFLKGISVLYSEKHFHDRIFNIFALKEPLEYKDAKIQFLEISEPGGSDKYERGFQHIELLTNNDWSDTDVPQEIVDDLKTESKYGNEIYMKWPDKKVVKVTKKPIIVAALTEDNPEITVL